VREAARERLGSIEGLKPEDVADAIAYIVTRPRRRRPERGHWIVRRKGLVRKSLLV